MNQKKQQLRINDEKLRKRLGFVPHKGQLPVLEAIENEDIKDIVLVCGRRWGKTFTVAYAAFREMLLPNRQVWIVAPTSDLTQKAFTEIVKFVAKIYEAGEYTITTKPYTKLRMANGSWIECKTADNPVSLIGEEVDLLIIDEAARLAPMTYDRELAATTMTRNGRTIFISTPRGMNWFYNKYRQVGAAEDGFVWNAPSSDNPLNTKEWLDKLRKSLPEAIYNEEYNAQFVDGASSVFRNIKDVVNDDCYEEPVPSHRYLLGVDLAKANDYTVLTCIDRNSHKVVAWDRFNKLDYPIQKNRIVTMARKYNNARIIVDSTGVGNPVTDDLRRESLIIDDFKFSNKSKRELVDKLNLFIEEKGIFLPNEPILLDELKSYGVEISETTGTIFYSAPAGLHDDCLKEGTLIKTIDGYKPIEDINVGDLVLTHKNRYRKVLKHLIKPFSGDWYKFNFQSQTPLELSYNHPIYSAIKKYGKNDGNIDYSKREWVLPENWKKGYRCVSLIEKLKENTNTILNEGEFYKRKKNATRNKLSKIKLDKKFAKFLGLFLAEGHAGRMSDKDYRCSLAFNKNHSDLIKEMKDYILSLGICVQEREYRNTSNAFALTFSSKFLHKILTYCYDKNREKQLPYYSKYLGKDLKYVLEYWLKGDGWKRNNHYIGATTSKSLGLSMRDIAFSIGKYASIRIVKRHRYEAPTKDQYWVEIYDEWNKTNGQRKLSSFEYGSKIRGIDSNAMIEKSNFNGNVYNLQVAEDESFVADGIVVHNCVMSLGLAVWGLYSTGTIKDKQENPINILLEEKHKKKIRVHR